MSDYIAVSVHPSSLVIQKCYDLLLTGLRSLDCAPTVMDFVRMFVNYGADLSLLGLLCSQYFNIPTNPNVLIVTIKNR